MGLFDQRVASQIPFGLETPFTFEARYLSGKIEFECPTCMASMSAPVEKIDPVLGINVICTQCKGVSHLPAVYKIDPEKAIIVCPNCAQKLRVPYTPPDGGRPVTCPKCRTEFPYLAEPVLPKAKIYGSLRVVIQKFEELYYSHPWTVAVIGKGQSDLLNQYGLWGYCAKCLHAFAPSVLNSLAIQQSMAARGAGTMIFNANSPESAKDMQGLQKGRCAHCGHTELVVLVAEISEEMKTILRKRM